MPSSQYKRSMRPRQVAHAPRLNVTKRNPFARIIALTGTGLQLTPATFVEPKSVDWLWPGYLARGMQFIFHGAPDAGKGTATVSLVAAVTTGNPWPDGTQGGEPGTVLWLNAEDPKDYVLVPRLKAAGADLSKVHFVDGAQDAKGKTRAFDLKRDLAVMEEQCRLFREIGEPVAVIVLDPLNSYLPGIKMNDQIALRAVLEPVTQFAERTGVTVISIAHDVKGAGYATSSSKIAGSGAYAQVMRGTFMIDDTDPDDKDSLRRFMPDKFNIGAKAPGWGFRIEGKTIEHGGQVIETSHAVWEAEPLAVGAEEAMREKEEARNKGSALGDAKEFLGQMLFPGPLPVASLEREAQAAGLSWRTVKRAKAELGIRSSKATGQMNDGWIWTLPGSEGGQRGD